MKAILNNHLISMRDEAVLHALKHYRLENNSDKDIVSTLKEINASVKLEAVLKQKTRNGGFVAWPTTTY